MLRVEATHPLRAFTLDVALEVAAGERLALAGPSGAGKTTILRVVAGLLRPQAGRVLAGGETWLDTARGIDVPAERRSCAMVFQDYALFPHLSAAANVAFALGDRPRSQRRAEADALLERFGLRDLAAARPAELSGGERQRVALARALARRPAALLLDEPLAALDRPTRAGATRELVALLHEAQTPTLLVTHDFTEAAMLAGRVAVVDQGRIVQEGTPSAVASRPASEFVAAMTGASVLSGTASADPQAPGLAIVELDGGGRVVAADDARGPVSVVVRPWDVALEAPGTAPRGSAQNHLPARVTTVTVLGSRVRVGLAVPQPLTAEITTTACERLDLVEGSAAVATWKATATRLLAR